MQCVCYRLCSDTYRVNCRFTPNVTGRVSIDDSKKLILNYDKSSNNWKQVRPHNSIHDKFIHANFMLD